MRHALFKFRTLSGSAIWLKIELVNCQLSEVDLVNDWLMINLLYYVSPLLSSFTNEFEYMAVGLLKVKSTEL